MKAIKYFGFGLASVLAVSACSDQFLQDKKNYGQVSSEIYEYYEGALGRLNDIYSLCLPTVNGISWRYPSMGINDDAAKSTEEYVGFSAFVNPETELSSMSGGVSVPDYFQGTQYSIRENAWGHIRDINDFIAGVTNGPLTEEQKNEVLGQAYFFRAWRYYNMFKFYGGVPIVTEVLNPTAESFTPRASSKETYEFILSDLNKSAELLAAQTTNGGWNSSNWGRITSGTALALKGRLMLLWASPLFNRANDQSRWQNAYSEMKKDLTTIQACGYGLYQTSNNVNGSDFANQFVQTTKNPEAVFVVNYNTTQILTGIDDAAKNNAWERYIRPDNQGGNGYGAGLMLVQLFPMADGKLPAGLNNYTKLETSSYTYESDYPFMNRDPRFYRTFAFPGFRWAYNGNAAEHDAHNPSNGANYTLWNYVWYTSITDQGNVESGNSYGPDNLLGSKQSIYVRKRSDDLDCNASSAYIYNSSGWKSGAGPFYSAAQLMEIRYAEVLLNLAEVACGAGQMGDAVSYLQQIRARAGYTAESNYGLQANLASDQATCMSAILYERQIELAYEGKRFDDMRRWMLFDGGAQLPEGAPATWKLSGWGGNTCTWLGYKALNGQRRESMEYRLADKYGVGTTLWNGDPLINAKLDGQEDSPLNLAAKAYIADHQNVKLDDAKNMAEVVYAAENSVRPQGVNFSKGDMNAQLESLKAWYQDNLVVKMKKGDGRDSQHNDLYINFRPKYYFLGFSSGVQNANKGLPQTIGWQDYNNGGSNGTFDPLAE
ncbi:MAG: RagB/SusD family nutrient uptake outer membrane protein [Prevotella sp.]|nr:RagB/SusD family nutrient uptake outer membrane protein [Prevotella sp.]